MDKAAFRYRISERLNVSIIKNSSLPLVLTFRIPNEPYQRRRRDKRESKPIAASNTGKAALYPCCSSDVGEDGLPVLRCLMRDGCVDLLPRRLCDGLLPTGSHWD